MKGDRQFHKDDHRHFNRNGEVFDKGETFSGVPLDLGLKAVEELKTYFGGRPLAQFALKWILSFPEVSTVIPGASKPEQIQSNVEASQLPDFNKDQMKAVQKIYDEYIRDEVHHQW